MLDFARRSDKERQEGFQIVAPMMKMNEGIIEKDFYVVLILELLFHHSKFGKSFAFKGGTSLSKGYNIIKRFSEDIDLVMDWSLLGLSDVEAWQERSHRQQEFFNTRINEEAGQWIEKSLVPELIDCLEREELQGFHVFVREEDKQTVIIEYPKHFTSAGILPEIRLEIGPLAAWTPVKDRAITSYIAEKLPNVFSEPSTVIPTVEAKRTFWEKATILHKEANRRHNFTPKRYSRHYYDLYLLAQSEIKEEAFADLDLLNRVVAFKEKFYLDNSAKYEEAGPATLKLLPKEEQLEHLRADYDAMQAMMFEKAPSFDEIMQGLAKLEKEIHQLGV